MSFEKDIPQALRDVIRFSELMAWDLIYPRLHFGAPHYYTRFIYLVYGVVYYTVSENNYSRGAVGIL